MDASAGAVTVALDLMGGDHAPESVLAGAVLAVDEQPGVRIVLVGPEEVTGRLLARDGLTGCFGTAAATQVVTMEEDPARGVRAKRDASVRVACRLVRDGSADAAVSVGSTGAALASGLFTLGRLPGMSRPALAAVVPARRGPLVLLDVGATTEATPELLAQFALCGAAFAAVRLGLPEPRVGLLSVGAEPGKGDLLRKDAYDALARLPLDFVGNVEGGDVPEGGRADVVVCDGFTGNVLLKGLEGTASMLTAVLREALTGAPGGRDAAAWLLPAIDQATVELTPEALGGAVLLGVGGVVVVGHGASSPRAVASCVRVAVQAVREQLVPRLRTVLAGAPDRAAAGGSA